MAVNFFDLLKKDHREAKTLLQELVSECRRGKVDEGKLEKACEELQLHMRIEEEILYPRVRKSGVAEDMIEDAYSEHERVKKAIREMEGTREAEQLESFLETLLEEVDHHVEEEENELFPKLMRSWDDETIKDVSQHLSDMKEKETAR